MSLAETELKAKQDELLDAMVKAMMGLDPRRTLFEFVEESLAQEFDEMKAKAHKEMVKEINSKDKNLEL